MEAGEQRSLVERLYKELGSRLQAFLYRLTGSHADAIELAQETYLRMLQIKDMDAIRSPKAYMFRVAANLAAEEATRRGRARATLDISDAAIEAELSHDPGLADQIDAAELAARRDAALAELPLGRHTLKGVVAVPAGRLTRLPQFDHRSTGHTSQLAELRRESHRCAVLVIGCIVLLITYWATCPPRAVPTRVEKR
jgi:hypothetical protein